MASDGMFLLLFAAISLVSAAAAIVLTGRLQARISGADGAASPSSAGRRTRAQMRPGDQPRRYVFRGGKLISGIERDDAFLDERTAPEDARRVLMAALKTLDPKLPGRIAALFGRGASFVRVGSISGDEIVVAGYPDGKDLVILIEPALQLAASPDGQAGVLTAIQNLSGLYRHLHDVSDDLQWYETIEGAVTWANPAYLDCTREVDDGSVSTVEWPLPRLFEGQLDPPPGNTVPRRCQVQMRGQSGPNWFEVRATAVDGGTLYNARPIDHLVASETSLRDFVQTLSKTFANLPIGLAVFDRQRELVMFNPALIAISTMEAGYLSGRPKLAAFLDQLRERQRMPEPRNYLSWRDEITRLEEGAAADTYHEIWTLPEGESLRVTGRPHPDGAIAFMFEDISREISLTRRMRGELDLWRTALDSADRALLVTDREGRVLRVNAAYRTLFGLEKVTGPSAAETSPSITTLDAATRGWTTVFGPSAIWSEIVKVALNRTPGIERAIEIPVNNGGALLVRVVALGGGHSAIWFSRAGMENDAPLVSEAIATPVDPQVRTKADPTEPKVSRSGGP